MAADPARSSAHLPDWSRRWSRRLSTRAGSCRAGRPSWAGATRGRSAASSTSKAFERARVPRTTNPQGLGIIAPSSILDYPQPEQVQAYALPILRGEKAGCLQHEQAGHRQRPRRARDARRAARRPLVLNGRKDLDLGRELRRLLLPVLPHRPRSAEAPRHQRGAGRDGPPRRPGEAAARDRGPPSSRTSTRCSSARSRCPRASSSGRRTTAGRWRAARLRTSADSGVAQRGARPAGVRRASDRERAEPAREAGPDPARRARQPGSTGAPGRTRRPRAASATAASRSWCAAATRPSRRVVELDEQRGAPARHASRPPSSRGARGLDASPAARPLHGVDGAAGAYASSRLTSAARSRRARPRSSATSSPRRCSGYRSARQGDRRTRPGRGRSTARTAASQCRSRSPVPRFRTKRGCAPLDTCTRMRWPFRKRCAVGQRDAHGERVGALAPAARLDPLDAVAEVRRAAALVHVAAWPRYMNDEAGIVWLSRIFEHFRRVAWWTSPSLSGAGSTRVRRRSCCRSSARACFR